MPDGAREMPQSHELVELDPPAAAERILAALRGWGYLGPVTGE